MAMTRSQFCNAFVGVSALLILQGCGGGGSDYGSSPPPPPGPPPAPQCGASGTAITGNHGHTLTIPEADLSAAVDKTYNIMGTAGHNHTVTFTVAQLAQLKTHQSVTVTSTTTAGHSHNVAATC